MAAVPHAPQGAPTAPAPVQHMPAPGFMTGVPPGLEYLSQVDQLLVHQQTDSVDLANYWETEYKYFIKNTSGQQVYYAAEVSNFCERQFCGALRSFEMSIFDNTQKEVIHLIRPYRCFRCCCFNICCQQEIEVHSPPGTTIGWVKEDFSFIHNWFSIKDVGGNTILKIKYPSCQCIGCGGDINISILSADGAQEVGTITKQFTGDYFNNSYEIQFPMDLDVKVKATLLGALFLIDFIFFQSFNKKNRGGLR